MTPWRKFKPKIQPNMNVHWCSSLNSDKKLRSHQLISGTIEKVPIEIGHLLHYWNFVLLRISECLQWLFRCRRESDVQVQRSEKIRRKNQLEANLKIAGKTRDKFRRGNFKFLHSRSWRPEQSPFIAPAGIFWKSFWNRIFVGKTRIN